MANSFTFNSVDLADFDLIIRSSDAHILSQVISYVQLKDRGYSSGVNREPKTLNFDIAVLGTSVADVISNLDNIKKTLVTEETYQLVLDVLPTRYFNAQFQSIDGRIVSPTYWEGSLSFLCVDPLGYSTSETNSPFNIDADPKTILEIVGGTGMVNPVYTLTAGEALGAITLLIENLNTGEELSWAGTLGNGDVLEIDVEHWIIYNEGVADMAGMTGQFPRLQPGNNLIKITDFSNTGTLAIVYRETYL